MKATLTCLLAFVALVFADDDTFRERFADPSARALAITELVPGTRDAWFYTALDHQLAGRNADFEKTIAEWKAATEREKSPVSDQGLATLENRQLLLDYRAKPDASLAALIRRLDLRFDDARPDAAAAEKLPTRLDPALITEAAFEKAAAEASPQAPYAEFSQECLMRELDDVENFDEAKTQWFLEHLDRADLPAVVPLVDRALNAKRKPSFTKHRLLSKLTSGQLKSLLKIRPDLRERESFSLAYLAKLRPGAETDFARDIAAHAAHLQQCRDYAIALPPAQNSLKAHVLYHHLRLQRELGKFPKNDFLAYLALPRKNGYLFQTEETPAPKPIKLDANYSAATGCAPIENEQALVVSLLKHYLRDADSAKDYAPFIEERTLARIHAEARLLAGAPADQWGKLLDPSEFKALQESTLIDFAPGTPDLLDSAAAVSLALDLKNTPDLLVRIYELDLPVTLAKGGSQPDVSIDLDGLVPHHERRISYSQPPMVMHRETIALPELSGPGVWLVDFVSGQTSARALIRKGQLTPFIERTASGQTVRVFDENSRIVKDARITLGHDTFTADASGIITIPDAPNQPTTAGLLIAGKLAAPITLGTRSDELALEARFFLAREQLLADQEARAHLRIRLTNHGHELPLDRIKEPTIVLKAHLLGDITTERVIAENLKLAPTMEVPFQVPADLLELTLTLRGTVSPAIGGDSVKLEDQETYAVNQNLRDSSIATVFFSPTTTGHRLELRGRNGEPLPSRSITLTCMHDDYHTQVKTEVRTDTEGRVDLGALDGIEIINASGTGFDEVSYEPKLRWFSTPRSLHLAVGSTIRLPLEKPAAAPDHWALSLLETIDDKPVRDHFDKLAIEDGQLVIRNLPPGDFILLQNYDKTRISISPSQETSGLLASPARIMAVQAPPSPTIASATADNGQLRIQLRDFSPQTRVTIVGKRYEQAWDAGSGASPFAPLSPESIFPGFAGCGFLTDRRLSDEMRYILDRRLAKTFPGSMLPRPGLLLHRWTEQETDQSSLAGGYGAEGVSRGANAPTRSSTIDDGGRLFCSKDDDLFPTCDFLKSPAVVKFDLAPAADGSLALPLADFVSSQFLNITAVDTDARDNLIVPMPASDTPLRDQRLARPLDPASHYVTTHNAAVLKKGAAATIENLLDADWRAFTTLAEAHQFLYGITSSDRLRDFTFLTEWPDLPEAKKLELLSQNHCHELHLFLARKDKPFFEKHVKPLLAQKLEPQFIDDYLLDRDLNSYLRPYAWRRLNAAEKALLAQALPDARARIARELRLRWQLEAPAPDAETKLFTQTLRGTDLATEDSLGLAREELETEGSPGVAQITNKLDQIMIPMINFEDTTVEDALDFLRQRSRELDTLETDPSQKGVNVVVRRSSNDSDPGAIRIHELRLRNVPLGTAMQYICDATGLRYKIDEYAVTFEQATGSDDGDEGVSTRRFPIPEGVDFGIPSGVAGEVANEAVKEMLQSAGVEFSEGSSIKVDGNFWSITNTAEQLNRVADLTQAMGGELPRRARNSEDGVLPSAFNDAADPFAEESIDLACGSAPPPILLRFPERTRLWREANYDYNFKASDESLIPLNAFWLDLAAWDGKSAFLSPHFNACKASANDALMCLAMLDLPFKAERPEVKVDGNTLRVKAREPMLLFYKDTRRADELAKDSPLLLRQSFSPLGEKFRTVDGHKIENPVTGDFLRGVPYAMSLTVTNPSGIGRRIDVLAQVPAGTIPLASCPATLSHTAEIAPHGVETFELAFYFPEAGDFQVYPLHVSEQGKVLAHTEARTLHVSGASQTQDSASWLMLARDGSDEAVLKRLQSENLATINLNLIRWRLKDKAFFLKVVAVLRDRLHFSPGVFAYGFHHNDAPAMRAWLENTHTVHKLGMWLDSPLLDVRPRVHHDWQALEFDPLINARAHRFGENPRMANEQAREHYHAFLSQLAWKPALDANDQLTLTAYLFLQDRVEEALARFAKVDPTQLAGRVNYDYLHTVALFYQEKPEDAKAIAAAELPKLPPGLWRDRFQAVVTQADEIAALATPRKTTEPQADTAVPKLDIALAQGGGKLVLRHRALGKTTLRLFSVDLEMLFSKFPFLTGEAGSILPSIRPNDTLEVTFAEGATETTIDLPEPLRHANLLVAADVAGSEQLVVLDSSSLEILRSPQERMVQVLDSATHKPLVKTYVKVYAEYHNGTMDFHKDGYTDLRGKFDYLSHTGLDVATVKRVAILISHPEKGARTVIYEQP